jgi:hypothetical protein
MKRIILFRFHNNLTVCKNRVRLLRQFNPDIDIYGLYGGEENCFRKVRIELSEDLKDTYCIKGKSPLWKWKNSDLAVKLWFEDYGKNLAFDVLHIIEWDMLMLDSIDHIYKNISEHSVGLSGLTAIDRESAGWIWTSSDEYKAEMDKLLLLLRKQFDYKDEPLRCITGGACLPRGFIEKYSQTDIPELCNDEVRLPLFAQIFGINILGTGFYDRLDENKKMAFNLKKNIETTAITNALNKAGGMRVFHPYYKVYKPLSMSEHLYNIHYDIKSKIKNFLKTVLGKRACKSFKNILNKDYKNN